ncbi:MAG: hypothetical protein KA085_12265 [Phenylobacterium sp.]|uniref:hypothetical protein n=1 Tax=Phenylobacterium sp. TaxID=1871053 RepID=UPI001B3D2780|nr:hypothetical protein [Phenylobacterium sp.]MBP7649365.1 hypothetical protein [Phenylobacterium sp.]MBP7816895.1 hypothetical protein [Phenylobacterium sp.]MBP8246174.1 hypothetical protein [Phenylobacterium sp.]
MRIVTLNTFKNEGRYLRHLRLLGLVAHRAPSRRKVRTHQVRDLHSTSGLAILTRAQGVADVLALASHPAVGLDLA